ncbi:MAG: methionine synthase [Planctomycetes bacterium]|nr:methionine synthase [Planctomycetota bacterium]
MPGPFDDRSAALIEVAARRVFVLDGAMGTSVQRRDLPLSDYQGHENCVDVITLTRPDVVVDIHRGFLAVGCDAVSTNTFGANKIVFSEFGIAEQTYVANRRAAELARQACREFEKPGRPRFVFGSMGPGTKLPTLGQTTWDALVDSYAEQARGLLDGGVDALIIETCQDILQAKAAIVAATDAMREKGRAVPIFCTVTIETTGTMLVGTEIAAAVTAIEAYPEVVGIGLNCATGPQEMSEHIRYLSSNCDRLLVVQPNAGLPQLVGGKPHYALTPAELTRWLVEFVEADGVNLVGGCCGTTPEHLAAVVDAMEGRRPRARRPAAEPAVASVYQSVPLRQENAYLAIGERTNANGSKKFRELLATGDVDGMVQMAREQVRDGSHLLDVCAAYVGRNEAADMTAVIRRFVADVTVPLVIDSTEVGVIETALKLAGGRCVINSINLEDGEEKLDRICRLARRHGAAVIALTIDERGMAKTAERKVTVARRILELAVGRHGLRPCDMIFDPLTFTIVTGNEDDRRLGLETLEALAGIKAACPGVHTVLGASNISFGLKPAARRVLNSVFLHAARERGLDAAIVHVGGILPLYKIEENHRRLAEDLIFDRRRPGYDPLHELLQAFENVAADKPKEAQRPRSIPERLKQRILNGDRTDLEADLDEAMLTFRPLDIINDILLDGMKTVGDLFGAGQMQLPFVLQSAETMKAAVKYLEPYMDRVGAGGKGSLVLATVRGDVHDIGKNLVDIILTNNGYTVYNLGIKQPINNIIEAYEKHGADAIGMSGLLVKSTVVMRENLAVLTERGIDVPVILGGAALTRKYVEQDLRPEYRGPLHYAKDAFAGLHLMDEIVAGGKAAGGYRPTPATARTAATPAEQSVPRRGGDVQTSIGGPADLGLVPPAVAAGSAGGWSPADLHDEASTRFGYVPPRSNISRDEPVPPPPFWGCRVVDFVEPRAALAYLNENMLFQVQWQYRKARRSPEEFKRYINDEVRPILRNLLEVCERERILTPRAVYGFWPAQSDGDTLIIFDPACRERELVRFEFPRMGKPPYWCLSDFFKPVSGGVYDVAAFSVVTAGRRVSEVAREWFAADRYQDYLHLHGLGVELAEALAEYIHKQIRVEWGIAGSDARERQEIFKQRYQGSRYSFGYPACPRLEDQVKLWPLLQPERIEVTLSEEFQLEPEQTTTALIVHHRQAKYFNVR